MRGQKEILEEIATNSNEIGVIDTGTAYRITLELLLDIREILARLALKELLR